jgi:hypothetical protein
MIRTNIWGWITGETLNRVWIAALGIAIVILFVILGYELAFIGQPPPASDPSSLKLYLSLSSSAVRTGGNLSITVSVTNTLPTRNDVAAADSWQLGVLLAGPCSPYTIGAYAPVDYAVIPGYYTTSNVSSAVGNQSGLNCGVSNYAIHSYDFQPSSDIAAINGTCAGTTCPTRAMNYTITVSGYWNDVGMRTPFQPGQYTAVGVDEWGHMVISHFTVT